MAVRAPHAGAIQTGARRPAPRPARYPESDGTPIGETDAHVLAIFDAFFKIDTYFRDRDDVYVASDNLLYYEEGNPRRFVSPDVYVVPGARKGLRRVYLLWDEGRAPGFVLEVSSRDTRRVDLGPKKALYARLGVGEYLIFDPLGEYLRPPLVGFRLVGGRYEPIVPEGDGTISSGVLGLSFRPGGRVVTVLDPTDGRELLSARDVYAAREVAEAANRAAQVEIARLRAELARRDADRRPD